MKLVAFRPRRPQPPTPEPPGSRLRRAGTAILVVGMMAATLLYWLETRHPEPSLDDLMPGYARAESRQMGIMYGQAGVVMLEIRQELARPGVQAGLILVIAGLAAAGCFRIAWLDAEHARQP